MKHWSVLENKKEHEAALKRIDELMENKPGLKTEARRELKLLIFLVERYEEEHYQIASPDPIEAIKIRMDDLGLEAKDLVDAIGDKGTVSKVLNRKVQLSLRMIRNLSKLLSIPVEILIQEQNFEAA